jgi:peroxiredoxin
LLVSVTLLSFWLSPTAARQKAAPANSDSFQQVYQEGVKLLRAQNYEGAIKAFKRANSLREQKCGECYLLMARAEHGRGEQKRALENCDRSIATAGENKMLLAAAHNLKGNLLLPALSEKDEKRLAGAVAEFRQALAQAQVANYHFNLGRALLRSGQEAEGVAELKAYLELEDNGRMADLARAFIQDPRRARMNLAPNFELRAASGERISLEQLRGKVVLLDFWGSWCGPCRESMPELRDLHKRFGKDPFVILSVSSDDDARQWSEFVTKNKMEWPQYLDSDASIQGLFEVDSFPTYVVIDSQGVIQLRISGWAPSFGANLDDQIKKSLKAARRPS